MSPRFPFPPELRKEVHLGLESLLRILIAAAKQERGCALQGRRVSSMQLGGGLKGQKLQRHLRSEAGETTPRSLPSFLPEAGVDT